MHSHVNGGLAGLAVDEDARPAINRRASPQRPLKRALACVVH